MQYNTTYRNTLTKGISAAWTKMTSWKHIPVCPKCGEKVTSCTLASQPEYRCECITDEEWRAQ